MNNLKGKLLIILSFFFLKCDFKKEQSSPQVVSPLSAFIQELEALDNEEGRRLVDGQRPYIKIEFAGYDSVRGFRRVTSLGLIGFNLPYLPHSINQFHQLETLALSYANLKELPELNLPNLEYLSLEGNHFRNIPKTISSLKKLERLVLSKNKLTGEINFSSLPKSTYEIDLSSNNIISFNIDSELPNLKRIDISNNLIHGLDSTLCSLPSLEFIDVSNNRTDYKITTDTKSAKCLKKVNIINERRFAL